MSAGHLSREFRLAYGESPYSYLMTRRIERAMALLRRGDLSVTEVCFAVGCSSLGTFSTRFTELVGVPPSVYRQPGGAATAGMPACVAKQVTRPIRNREAAGRRAAPSVTAMDITIHSTFLPHDDPDAALAFYRDTLGFEVRNDVGYGGHALDHRRPPGQPGTSIVLHPPAADPGVTDDERRTIGEMMAKGTYAMIVLATKDLDGTFERLQAAGAEIVQEPIEQPYGSPRLRRPRSRRQPDPHQPSCAADTRRSGHERHPRSPDRSCIPCPTWRRPRRSTPRLLGVHRRRPTAYYVGFEAAGQHIGLVPGGGPQGMTSPVAYWHVPDIEAKLAEVTAAGATVKEPAHDVGGGRLVATFTDPDGNVLGLLQDR